jgi:YtkA-like protein
MRSARMSSIDTQKRGVRPFPIMMRTPLLAMPLLLVVATGCGGSGPSTEQASSSICAKETRADHYSIPLPKEGTGFQIELLDALPAPPERDLNTWTVMVMNPAGVPVDGVTLSARPYMPDHGHYATVKATVTPLGEGRYELKNIQFFMPGLWETTIDVTMPGTSTPVPVKYNFCIDG